MPAIARPPPGHPHHHQHSSDEYDTVSRSSSQSPPDNDELWADPDDLLAIPAYDASVESTSDPLFPSPHKFNLMVQDYLRNLSPKKREKALLTQKMYDAVLSVLQDPKDTSTKTAQFRFWAKKMFQLTSFGGEKVVCHDHKPVAVKEQIYEVLCHCHGQAGHGGRDKTSAQVRRYYSWIPKEIIARFVRDCPFCQSRRTQSSAGLSNMSESQAFLISLQTTDTQIASKRPVSLAQARANAAALGHKPYRRPSIRTIESCRSRRGSAVSDDGYIHYADGSIGMGTDMDSAAIDPSMSSQSSMYDVEHDHASGANFVPGFEFGACPSVAADNGTGGQPGGLFPQMPPMPRRASSYHEQLLLNVRPSAEAMHRRNSESNIATGHSASAGLLYSCPGSALTDASGGNQFLSVPGMSALSRNTSSSSLNSLNDDSFSEYRYYPSGDYQLDGSYSNDGSAIDDTEVKLESYRVHSAYPVSGSVTPLEGTFPLSVHMGSMNGSLFPTDITSIPSTYSLPLPMSTSTDYHFPTLNAPAGTMSDVDDEALQMHTMSNWGATLHPASNVSPDAASLAAVQRMLDSNNIFALGAAAGLSQDQVVDMHDFDPGMLDLNDLRSQMEALGTSTEAETEPQLARKVSNVNIIDDHASQLGALNVSMGMGLGMGMGVSMGTGSYSLPLQATSTSAEMDPTLSNASSADYALDEKALEQMELAFAQVMGSAEASNPVPAPPTVIIERPVENIFFAGLEHGCPTVLVDEPKSEIRGATELDLSNWAGFAMA
ncbi:hypothetical protein I316_05538 [Kwoniella heveanensis BCC8398]|uniref:Integrase zinc-binding domain-containing protein n=1 Tax=Kwoniella heveanensis BCC8398 TaxID=1296120 RepID=A0A1B9GPG5_9TREE|nr:hypothetical protein I316_05538 [Kwoniella heveanensis BCC8398]